MVRNSQNIFMEHDLNIIMIFWHKRKFDNFDPYIVFLAIATNIPQRLKTGFMAQSHTCHLKPGARLICSSAAGV